MEKEFTEWFKENEDRFSHGQFDEKQIAYSAWLEGKKYQLANECVCPKCGSETLIEDDDELYCKNCCTIIGLI